MFASILIVFAVLPLTFVGVGAEDIANSPYEQGDYSCVLPPYPEHGSYSVLNYPYAIPGDRYSSVKLDITCDTEYFNNNTIGSLYCVNGDWSAPMPMCVQDFSACGLIIQNQLEGTDILELPWHVVIYKKISGEYSNICGGSLITDTKIISAARCFYDHNGQLQPPCVFMVAVNKVYYSDNDTRNRNRQLSDVTDIKISSTYRGEAMHYEDDIAVVIVKTPFFFYPSVRPVCLDFDNDLERTQLTEGNSGKAVRWNVHWVKNGQLFDTQNVFDYKYLKIQDCELKMLYSYDRRLLTKDKFCTTVRHILGTQPDSTGNGNGLVFFEPSSQRYYLRGVLANYVTDTSYNWMMIYTSIMKHEDFIKKHL